MDYINEYPDGIPIPNEPVKVKSGPIYLKFHNDKDNTLNLTIFTGLNQSLQQITDYTLHNDPNPTRQYRKYIVLGQSVLDAYPNEETVYLNYTSTGFYVDDIYAKSVDDRLTALEDRPIGGGSGLPVQVVSVTPLPDSIDIEVNAPIYATINKWLDDNQEAYMKAYPSALDRDNDTNSIGIVERYNNKTLRLTHIGNNFEFTSIVYVRIFAGLTAIDGMQLPSHYDFSFQTASAPPNDDPIVTLLQTKVGSILKTGYTIQYNFTNTNPEPGETVTVKLYEKRIGTDSDFIYKGDIVGSLVSGNYEFAQTGSYNYGQQVQYKIGLFDGYNAEVLSSPLTVNIPANQAPTTPGITASISAGGDITFRMSTTPTDPEGHTLTYTVAVDGIGYAGYIGVNASTITTNQTLDTNFPLGEPHTIKIVANDGYGGITESSTLTLTAVANQAPSALSVAISGTTTKGSTLTGSYTYSDNESDPQGTSTFRWLRDGVAISGATATTYILVEADVGKTITFEVTPKATSGTLTGTPVTSSGTPIPVPAPPSLGTPTAGDGKITDTFTSNATLTTETYFTIHTTDGSTPTLSPLNGTRTNGITSPFDILATNGTTVKVALGMTVNGQDSVLSAVVSGVTGITPSYQTLFTGTNGTAPDSSKFTTTGLHLPTLNGSGQVVFPAPGAGGETSAMVRTVPLNLSVPKKIKFRWKRATNAFITFLQIMDGGSIAEISPGDYATNEASKFGMWLNGNGDGRWFYNNLASFWKGSPGSASWSAGNGVVTMGLAVNTYYWAEFETDGTRVRGAMYQDDGTLITQTAWVNISSLGTIYGNTYLVIGDNDSQYYGTDLTIDEYLEF